MPIDIDLAAVLIMECLGAISFFMAFLFFKQRQRISDKQRAFLEALNKGVINERGDGKCYSFEWVLGNIVYKRRKILNATPLFMTSIAFLSALFFYMVGPHMIANLLGLGYANVVAIIGVGILFLTDAFEAYNYADAILKVSTYQLDKEDQSYIEIASGALQKAFLRFAILGVAFAVFSPFIPQIFEGLVYAFILYANAFFHVSKESVEVLHVLGFLIVMILAGFMLFLPVFLGQIAIRKAKSPIRKIFKGKIEQ